MFNRMHSTASPSRGCLCGGAASGRIGGHATDEPNMSLTGPLLTICSVSGFRTRTFSEHFPGSEFFNRRRRSRNLESSPCFGMYWISAPHPGPEDAASLLFSLCRATSKRTIPCGNRRHRPPTATLQITSYSIAIARACSNLYKTHRLPPGGGFLQFAVS